MNYEHGRKVSKRIQISQTVIIFENENLFIVNHRFVDSCFSSGTGGKQNEFNCIDFNRIVIV